ncbi:hypothetical protein [Campylobacter curvus]|nr:hypothetical protein [Campylobacter curvus]
MTNDKKNKNSHILASTEKKERLAIKEKMQSIVLQNPKVKAVFERLKDK